jgi:hypothetical protein
VLLERGASDSRPVGQLAERDLPGLFVVSLFQCEPERRQVSLGHVLEELVDGGQHAVRDGLFGDRRLREHLDIPVGLQLPEEVPDVALVEGDDRVVLPALAVARRRLGQAVVGLEALDDGVLERAEKGPGDDADPRLVDRLVE